MTARDARSTRMPLARFVFVGGATTVLYFILARLAHQLLAVPESVASLAAYTLAAGFSYLAHRDFTFRSRRPHRVTGWRFALLAAGGYVIAFAVPSIVTVGFGGSASAGFVVVCLLVPTLNAFALFRLVFAHGPTAPPAH